MTTDKDLVNRLNRITGQIQGISNRLERGGEKECLKTIQQLKASINALKKFGEAYIAQHMQECLATNKDPKSMQDELEKVIKGAFSL